MQGINSDVIKSDYCEKLREIASLKEMIEDLTYRNSVLIAQRSRMRQLELRRFCGRSGRARAFRAGLLIGAMVTGFIFTAVVYAATH